MAGRGIDEDIGSVGDDFGAESSAVVEEAAICVGLKGIQVKIVVQWYGSFCKNGHGDGYLSDRGRNLFEERMERFGGHLTLGVLYLYARILDMRLANPVK